MLKNIRTQISIYLAAISPSVLVFCLFFALYTLTIYGQIRYGDEAERYLQAKSVVEKQTLIIPFIPGEGTTGVNGNPYSQFEMGFGLWVIPFYAFGHWIAGWFSPSEADRITLLYVSLANPVITALTCVVLYAFARAIGLAFYESLATTFVFGFATIAWPYSKGLYREALQSLCLLLAVYAVYKARVLPSQRWLWISGSAFGFLALTKVANLAMLPVFLGFIVFIFVPIWANWKILARWMRAIQAVIVFLIPVIACLVFQGIINVIKFGDFLNIGPYNYGNPLPYFSFANLIGGLVGLLVSFEKGLVFYVPPVLLFVPAWILFFFKNKIDAIFVLLLIVLHILFSASYVAWDGGSYWGPRYLVEIVPLMMLPLGFLWQVQNKWTRWIWRLASTVIVGLGLGVQLLGAWANDREYMDIVGKMIDIGGALDLVRHSAMTSLMFSLTPNGFQTSFYGALLISVIVLCGIGLVLQPKLKQAHSGNSLRASLAALVVGLGLILGGMVIGLVAGFSTAFAAQGNTYFTTAESFYADKRFCEAEGFYSRALYFDTRFSQVSANRLLELAPLARGTRIDIGDLEKLGTDYEYATAEWDSSVKLFEDGSLRLGSFHAPANLEADSPFFSIVGNTRYELSGWLRTSGIAGDTSGIIGWYEDNGKWQNPRTMDVVRAGGTHGWVLFRQTITTLATTKRALVKAGLWDSSGAMWIEGLRLVQVSSEVPSPRSPACR